MSNSSNMFKKILKKQSKALNCKIQIKEINEKILF